MTDLTIAWQRLVDAGQTCPRCGDTGSEVRTAAATLTAALAPLGITVRLAEATINLAQFEQAPLESNRILIAGRPLEDWLGGATSQSPCCDVCGPNDCRTITVDDTTYETVPAGLITRAGLLAAAELLAQPSASHDDPTQETTGTTETCCGPTAEPTRPPEPFTAAGNQGRLLLRGLTQRDRSGKASLDAVASPSLTAWGTRGECVGNTPTRGEHAGQPEEAPATSATHSPLPAARHTPRT